MYSWKAALMTLVIFGLGGLAGSLITAQVIKTKIEQVKTSAVFPDVHDGDFPARMAHVMEVQVKLTPEQVKRVRSILRDTQLEVNRLNGEWQQRVVDLEPGSKELIAARNEWRLKSRRVFVRMDDTVRGLLTVEQRPLFEEFIRKRRALFQQNRGGPPPRPGDRMPERPVPPRA
jgi:hypothetical protein